MKDHMIRSMSDLVKLSEYYRKGHWVFRGVARRTWKLLPKIGRPGMETEYEAKIFERFVREAPERTQEPLPRWNLEWMSLAQHFGLPTRLLDWTDNPFIAAFFACREEKKRDGALYMLKASNEITEHDTNPFKVTTVSRYRPPHITTRIAHQRGLFTIHPEPSRPLPLWTTGPVEVHRAIIQASVKENLLWRLSRQNVNMSTVFPDLVGLSSHIAWMFSGNDPSDELHITDIKLQTRIGWIRKK